MRSVTFKIFFLINLNFITFFFIIKNKKKLQDIVKNKKNVWMNLTSKTNKFDSNFRQDSLTWALYGLALTIPNHTIR